MPRGQCRGWEKAGGHELAFAPPSPILVPYQPSSPPGVRQLVGAGESKATCGSWQRTGQGLNVMKSWFPNHDSDGHHPGGDGMRALTQTLSAVTARRTRQCVLPASPSRLPPVNEGIWGHGDLEEACVCRRLVKAGHLKCSSTPGRASYKVCEAHS